MNQDYLDKTQEAAQTANKLTAQIFTISPHDQMCDVIAV